MSRPVDDGAVAGNELRIRAGQLHGGIERFQRALQRTAIVGVNVGIAVIPVEIADHDRVRILKPDHCVAAGVGRPNRNQIDDFPIHMKFQWRAQAIGDDGERGRIARRCRIAIGQRRRMQQFFAKLFTRKDCDAHLGEVRVAAGVVDVHMGDWP